MVGKIIYLRQNYHFGPGKIAVYLKRYHDVEISNSGVWRILKRMEMNRLPVAGLSTGQFVAAITISSAGNTSEFSTVRTVRTVA